MIAESMYEILSWDKLIEKVNGEKVYKFIAYGPNGRLYRALSVSMERIDRCSFKVHGATFHYSKGAKNEEGEWILTWVRVRDLTSFKVRVFEDEPLPRMFLGGEKVSGKISFTASGLNCSLFPSRKPNARG